MLSATCARVSAFSVISCAEAKCVQRRSIRQSYSSNSGSSSSIDCSASRFCFRSFDNAAFTVIRCSQVFRLAFSSKRGRPLVHWWAPLEPRLRLTLNHSTFVWPEQASSRRFPAPVALRCPVGRSSESGHRLILDYRTACWGYVTGEQNAMVGSMLVCRTGFAPFPRTDELGRRSLIRQPSTNRNHDVGFTQSWPFYQACLIKRDNSISPISASLWTSTARLPCPWKSECFLR